ncbi:MULTISPECIES: WD40 repeat domain-containing protein [Rhizobium]|nr:WD40 repeat domain-containing protein [Rhizobium acaciae]MCW1410731.1 WD40 repeat domain-containing protein [Rhizobium acaciae]MCW1750166.1 WD40 repeat domain-containing protein [Rhizobium acaciae]
MASIRVLITLASVLFAFAVSPRLAMAAGNNPFDLVLPFGHTNVLQAATISGDGKWLFTADVQGTVAFWRVDLDGKSVARLKMPEGKVGGLATNRDGSLVVVVVGTKDGDKRTSSAKVLSTDTFTEVNHVTYNEKAILTAAISDDGKKLATAEDPFRIVVTDLLTGGAVNTGALSGRPGDLRFIDGDKALAESEEGVGILVRRISDLAPIRPPIPMPQMQAPVTAFDPIANLSYVFQFTAAKPSYQAFSPDFATTDGVKVPIPVVRPTTIATSPDGKIIAFGGFGTIRLLTKDGARPGAPISNGLGPFGDHDTLLLSFVGPSRILSVNEDGTIAIFDTHDGSLKKQINPLPGLDQVRGAFFTAGGRSLVMVRRPPDDFSAPNRITALNLITSRLIRLPGYLAIPLPATDGLVTFATDKTGDEETQRIRLFAAGAPEPTWSHELPGYRIAKAAFDPSGSHLLLADRYGKLDLYDWPSMAHRQSFDGHQNLPTCLKFSPAGDRFLVCDDDWVSVYKIETSAPLWTSTDFWAPRDGVFSIGCGCLVLGARGGLYQVDWSTGANLKILAQVDDPLVVPSALSIYAVFQDEAGNILASGEYGSLVSLKLKGVSFEAFHGDRAELEAITQLGAAGAGGLVVGTGLGLTLFSSVDFSQVARLFLFSDDRWLAVANDGRFDTNDFSLVRDIVWSFPEQRRSPLPVERLAQPAFVPHLLFDIVDGKPSTPIPLDTLQATQPTVTLDVRLADRHSARATLTVTGPIEPATGAPEPVEDIKLFLDGRLVQRLAPSLLDKNDEVTVMVALPTAPIGAILAFKAYAFSKAGIKSSDATQELTLEEGVGPSHPPRLWLVTIGVGANGAIGFELSYPPRQALDMQETLQDLFRQSGSLQTVLLPLISAHDKYGLIGLSPSSTLPTRDNILAVLAGLAGAATPPPTLVAWPHDETGRALSADPDDIIVIYYMGHGQNTDGRFSITPYSNGPAATLISEAEIADALELIQARAQILILDTCYSSSVGKNPGFKPGPFSSPGLSQVLFDKSILVVAAAAAQDEAQSIGETPLTAAMKSRMPANADGEQTTLNDFFNYVEDRGAIIATARSGKTGSVVSAPAFLRLSRSIMLEATKILITNQ